jgi:quercetin dioxygenase-like cupin family protein
MSTDPSASWSTPTFVDGRDIPWEDAGEGVKRKVMVYDANLMLVKVAFETGGIGSVHSHVHTQMSYVESGTFAITIADATRILQKGDTFYVPSNVRHGALCQEAGVLIDIFSPMRDDFI